jgi:hypothetical protein
MTAQEIADRYRRSVEKAGGEQPYHPAKLAALCQRMKVPIEQVKTLLEADAKPS